jgi:phosphomannomutase/phosphoglucomutase
MKMKEINAALAGEMSGHTFFNDRWYGFDDALYGAARLIEILSAHKDPSLIPESLPKGFSTPELNIALDEGQQHSLIKTLQDQAIFPQAQSINKIDGLRVEYEYGFGLMRASNTTPVIVLRFEADTDENLKKIQDEFKDCLSTYIEKENLPF